MLLRSWWMVGVLFLLGLALAQGEVDPREEAKRQKQLLLQTAGILPTELIVEQGKELFNRKGPKGKTMAECDFGLGKGVLEGAAARLPRYFLDTNKVEDLDSRIVTCMQTVQGYKPAEIKRDEVRAITTYIASFSSKAKIQVVPKHPAELAMYNLGRELWYTRAGARDMSCAICHDQYAGQRVRLSPVRSPKQGLGNEWPAYRFEEDRLYTMEDRINFCYESIAIPKPEFYSDVHIALTVYMLAEATKAGHSFEELPFFTR